MKRVKAACIQQTLHFMLKEDIEHDFAAKLVKEEVKEYKAKLERNAVRYKIIEETVQPDDSIIVKIRKQYNATTDVGEYFD